MLAKLVEACKSMNCIDLGAISLGLQTKTPIETQVAMRGLTRIQTEFPDLTDSDYDEEKKAFRLNNAPADLEAEVLFRLSRFCALDFAWGPKVPFGEGDDVAKLFTSIEEGFSILPINLEIMDFQIHCTCEMDAQHYAAIWDAYYKNSPLYSIFDPMLILENDVSLRSYLADHTICVVTVTSDVTNTEVRTGKFKDDRIKVSVGIARTRSFALGKSFAELATDHLAAAMPFVEEKFLGAVVRPLDDVLSELSDERGQSDES